VPSGHVSHLRRSTEEVEPTAHVVHAELALAVEIVPAGQAAHAPSMEGLKSPGRHGAHVAKGLPSNPAVQKHALDAAGEEERAGQSEHARADRLALYLPGVQARHQSFQ
jgi:hypothetical protein